MAECGGASEDRPVQCLTLVTTATQQQSRAGVHSSTACSLGIKLDQSSIQPWSRLALAPVVSMSPCLRVSVSPCLRVSVSSCFHVASLHSSSAAGQQLAGAGPGSLHTASVGFGVGTLWIAHTDGTVKGA